MTESAPTTKSLVMHSEARYYDILAWLLTLGREDAFRQRLVELARLQTGEAVLDVGCGTGTLAIAAKKRVGSSGTVNGIDASPEMIARARRKTAKSRVDVEFHIAVAEELPFPNKSFDVVLSTLMLHHLPRQVRERTAREMLRVLKPDGRLLAVDFATPARARTGLLARLHRHGHVALPDLVRLLRETGLRVAETGSVGVSDLQFVLAIGPTDDEKADANAPPCETRSLPRLPAPRWLFVVAGAVLLAVHAIVIGGISSRLTLSAFPVAVFGVLFVLMHGGVAATFHKMLRGRRHGRTS